MRVHIVKPLAAIAVAALGVFILLALSQMARASDSDEALALPLTGNQAQLEQIDLQKTASSQAVNLGEPVTYTVSIQNNGAESIEGEITDIIPAPLILQAKSVTATQGVPRVEDNTLTWRGNIPGNGQVVLTYLAIPPSTGSPQQGIVNTVIFDNGGGTLEASATVNAVAVSQGIWANFVNFIAIALVFLDDTLSGLGVPFAFGFAIILFTVIVRLVTFPLNMQQMRSSLAMQELQPRIKELQKKYAKDKEKLNQETMKLYQEAGVNPLGGCLPMVVQMPIWFALYRALFSLAEQGVLTEGFLWIPSLAGPVTDRTAGISWLFPFENGAPPVGWPDAVAYLVLPVLLVVSQLATQRMMTPQSDDPQQRTMAQMMMFMPFMFGYFSLIVPAGLSLYWFTSNVLAIGQQYLMNRQRQQLKAAKAEAPPPPITATVDPAPEPSVPIQKKSRKGSRNARRKRKSRK
ncbi:MAG: membrane protein insertase YidC [Anaerolineae bacterium]